MVNWLYEQRIQHGEGRLKILPVFSTSLKKSGKLETVVIQERAFEGL
jgi:hypothetical protein